MRRGFVKLVKLNLYFHGSSFDSKKHDSFSISLSINLFFYNMIRSSKSYVFVIIRNAARERRKNSVINTRTRHFVDIKILKMFKYSR